MANYGFASSDEVKYDIVGFPVGKYTVHAIDEKDETSGIHVVYEILSGNDKGSTAKVYYNTLSDNEITAKIAKQDIKRIGEATGKPVTQEDPIQGRIFMVDVEANKKNPQYTNVKAYLPADGIPAYVKEAAKSVADDSIPF